MGEAGSWNETRKPATSTWVTTGNVEKPCFGDTGMVKIDIISRPHSGFLLLPDYFFEISCINDIQYYSLDIIILSLSYTKHFLASTFLFISAHFNMVTYVHLCAYAVHVQ